MGRPARIWRRKGRNGWYATVLGRKVYLGDDPAEAQREFHRLKASGRPVDRSRLTVGALIDLFMVDCAKRVAVTTLENYGAHLARWNSHASQLVAAELKPFNVTAWLAKYPGWGPSTQHAAIGTVRTWARWCVDQGYLESDPLARLKRPPMGRRKPVKLDVIDQFLTTLRDGPFRDLCFVLLDTGARPGEIRTLTASNVDWNVCQAIAKGKSGTRPISLTDRAMTILRKYMKHCGEGPLLRTRWGNPWSAQALREEFRRLRAKMGIIGITAYQFRHAFWGRATRAGVDSVLIAKQLGHIDLSMLQKHYAHVDTDQLKRAVELAAGHDNTTSASSPPPQAAPEPSLAPEPQRGKTRGTQSGRIRKT